MTKTLLIALSLMSATSLVVINAQDAKPADAAAKPAAEAAKPADAATPAAAAASAVNKIILGVKPLVMQFDKTALTAKPGESVQILFTNKACALQHNFILCKPGKDAAVGAAADAMMQKDAAGAVTKGYIPDDPAVAGEILAKSSKLIGMGQNDVISFTAPAAGSYPYICTFPGHRYVMKGVLTVAP